MCLVSNMALSQKTVNSYKYVLVPNQFNFQKSADSYRINSLTKFLFTKAGYTTLVSNEVFPEDLAKNRCLALSVLINKSASMLRTKLNIQLVDCNNSVVFTTKEGQSREKEYQKAYHEAIRNAFTDIQELNYSYDNDQSKDDESIPVSVKDDKPSKKIEEKPAVVEAKPIVEKKVPVAKKKPVEVSKKIAVEKEKVKRPVAVVSVSVVENKVPVSKEKPVEVPKKIAVEKEKVKGPVAVVPVPIVENKVPVSKKKPIEAPKNGLEGKFDVGKWGACTISKSGEKFDLIGGDEGFVFANIFKTSKSNIYIIKWVAYKEPQLLEINKQGNLVVDSENGTKVYQRMD